MPWHLTADLASFLATARPHLTRDPARCTALLTIAETLRKHGPYAYGGEAPARFGWWQEREGGPVEGVFLQTPPQAPLLGPMHPDLARELAGELRTAGPPVSGVKGEDGVCQAFADAWAGQGRWRVETRLRLFRLGTLAPPHPAPGGAARRATRDDVPLAADWLKAFAADVGDTRGADQTDNAVRRVDDGCLFLWETDGRPVSLASRSPLIAGQSRVSPVYTPYELRGRGYAGAVTAAVSRDALDAGAEQVLLFTDLANPTSNALYQRLGYRPLRDYVDLEFHTDADPAADADADG
ncbi:GNAT family N-acetyltransferase [Streptomyces sp. NPDC051907]|uniref:GNAT family N-acetyltransferase n=1 Tax=Streptomyces sp. NPDC051907 TaxID=3155284 RepID=UPI00343D98EE